MPAHPLGIRPVVWLALSVLLLAALVWHDILTAERPRPPERGVIAAD